jgi:hypothetical protein
MTVIMIIIKVNINLSVTSILCLSTMPLRHTLESKIDVSLKALAALQPRIEPAVPIG